MNLIDRSRALTAPRYQPLWVLAISGVLGFRIGMVAYPNWQVAVEAAQVVAGLVKYPAGNPYYIYETKLWTILHQICAVALLSGVSEITLSKVLSGVMGMLSLQALAMCTFALCRSTTLAVGASLFVLATRSASNGARYPILLMATEHTYGSVGLSTFVLAAACLAGGVPALGGFLVGLMPAVHPSLGLWLWILVAACLAWDVSFFRQQLRPALKWFAAGAAITTVSLIVQLAVTYDVPRVDPVEAAKYLDAFVSFWDTHRAPVDFNSLAVILNRGCLALGLIWLLGFRHRLPAGGIFLIRIAVVGAAIGIAMAYASWIRPERIPPVLLMLMPSRLLNFDGMIVVALLIGMIGAYQRRLAGAALLMILVVGLLLSDRSMFWEWPPVQRWAWLQRGFEPVFVMQMVAIGLLCLAFTDRKGSASLGEPGRPARDSQTDEGVTPPGGSLRHVLLAVTVGVLAFTGFLTLRLNPVVPFRDRTTDPFFKAVAAEQDGLVLTAGSYSRVQLATRRPVLLGGALDSITYAPESGPAMQQILLDVYGADLLHPPEGAREKGVLPRWIHRELWEGNSIAKWQEIRRKYDVHVVLVPGDWQLNLPIAVDEGGFRLYRIPPD